MMGSSPSGVQCNVFLPRELVEWVDRHGLSCLSTESYEIFTKTKRSIISVLIIQLIKEKMSDFPD